MRQIQHSLAHPPGRQISETQQLSEDLRELQIDF